MIGYAPLLRRGDLTVNAVLFRQAVLGERSLMPAVKQTRGVKSWRLSLFGQDAKQIATHVYGDVSLSPRIAIENSLLGIYLAAMPRNARTSLLGETGEVSLAEASTYNLGNRRSWRLSSSFLRSCSSCVAEDVQDRGYSAWRVVHQVPFLDHCPRHYLPLSEWRDFATSRPNGLIGLPSYRNIATVIHEQTKLIAPSDGYAAYLSLWEMLSSGELPHLAIDNWSVVVGVATASAGDVRTLTAVVDDEIERRWGLTSVEVGRLLGIEKNLSVHDELSLHTRATDLARRMIVFDALRSLGMTPFSEDDPSQQEIHFESQAEQACTSTRNPLIVAKLVRTANNLGLRPSLAIALAASPQIKIAMREARTKAFSAAYRLIGACSTELLEEIDKSFQAGQNWARSALDRRCRI